MSETTRRWMILLAVGVAAALLAGCGPEEPEDEAPKLPPEFYHADHPPQAPPEAHLLRRDYRLREGDLLEIIYHVQHRRREQYRIKLQDVIDIRFPFNPGLNQEEAVQSDGTLHLDLIGSVRVFDRTIQDVRDELQRRYAKYLKNPVLTVSFQQSNVKIAELKQAITTSPRGQSRLVPVTPDGTISIPFITSIQAAGMTIHELHDKLNSMYREIGLEALEVTVNVETVAPMRVFVLGEVRIPGPLLNRTGRVTSTNEITLLQAISQAGSYIPGRAELSQVAVIRRRNLPRPQAAIINVRQLLENRSREPGEPVVADTSRNRYDLFLEDGDVVYVPTTAIAKRADYIEYVWTRGIRAVSGWTSSYAATDAVDWLGPNP